MFIPFSREFNAKELLSVSSNIPELVKLVVETLRDKKVENLKVIDVSKVVSYTDYFIIGTGNSSTHVQTMADSVARLVKRPNEAGIIPEADQGSNWVLFDGNFFILSLFQEEARKKYALEELWQDGEEIEI